MDDLSRDLASDDDFEALFGTPFERSAQQYARLGWWPMPLPKDAKAPPPSGMTGTRNGRPPSAGQLAQWLEAGSYDGRKASNIALRMPPDIIGIDVDDGYSKDGVAKVGAATLAALEAELGVLPGTVSSTARGWGESRIRFYRVPSGWRLRAMPGDSIEIVQHHHRYAVVWPSQHPDAGVYRWYDDAGDELDAPPDPSELPELPWPWLEALRSTGDGSRSVPATPEKVGAFYDDACGNAKPEALKGLAKMLERAGSRHDRLVDAACWAAREAFAGWYPMAQAEQLLRSWWARVMDNERRLGGTEFDDAIAWGIAQVDPASEQMQRKLAEAKQARLDVAASTAPATTAPAEEPRPAIRERLLSVAQLRAMPPPQPLVAHLLDLDSVALIYGRRGGAKSFLAVDLTASIATGERWQRRTVEHGPALYVVAEGAAGVGKRYDAWLDQHHLRNAPSGSRLAILPEAVNLMHPVATAEFATAAAEFGAKLIVLDTLARCMVGGDENSAKDMGIAIAHLDVIRRATGACVVAVHHSGKDTAAGARGSSALEAAADTVLEIGTVDDVMTIGCTKQKNHATPNPIRLRLQSTGESAVLVEYAEDGGGLSRGAADTLTALRDCQVPGGVPASVWKLSSGKPDGTFYRHRSELDALGLLHNVGSDKRPLYQVSDAGALTLSKDSHGSM